MIKKIKVQPDSRASKILFFQEADLEQFSCPRNVIPLFGPNGAGKSTLLNNLDNKEEIKLELEPGVKSHYYSYMNGRDNFKTRGPQSIHESFDPVFMKRKWDAQSLSEGQSILYSVLDLIDGLRSNDMPEEEGCDYCITLDEVDSGLSIDNIDMIMRKIKNVASKRSDVQIIFSFNNPRVLKHFNHVLSMYDGTMIRLDDDNDMARVIREHKQSFDKVRKKSNGRPKVFE